MRFNTGIAAMMEFVNGAYKWDDRPKEALEQFVLLLAPYAPHLAEEMWQVGWIEPPSLCRISHKYHRHVTSIHIKGCPGTTRSHLGITQLSPCKYIYRQPKCKPDANLISIHMAACSIQAYNMV